MAGEKGDDFYNSVGRKRIEDRQADELVGIARGLIADGKIEETEVQFLEKWLVANAAITGLPVIRTLHKRIAEVLRDGAVDADEKRDLLDTLEHFTTRDFEKGEPLKSSSLPLCDPAPALSFSGWRYCFTGTFNFGGRRDCEKAVIDRGATAGSLTQKTRILVVGVYATESWKHSAFGNKIVQACEWRDKGLPISIVSEQHWVAHLH